jgi:DegV family protein with EDD domain
MSKVAIVADSTTYVPKEYVDKYGIKVAPVTVIFGTEELKDGIEITPVEFYKRLRESTDLPTTSQPTPQDFKEINESLLAEGKDILGIYVSHKLSGTVASAEQAKTMFPKANIEVLDSLSVSMGTGWPIVIAARAAEKGASLAECRVLAEKAMESTKVYVMVDTLEYLHRGGRIGGAQRLLGAALNFKPILVIQDGQLEPMEKVRTRKKAIPRLLELTEEFIAGRTPVRIAVIHADDFEAAEDLVARAKARFNPVEILVSDVSPSVGTHAGPGTLGIAVMAGDL